VQLEKAIQVYGKPLISKIVDVVVFDSNNKEKVIEGLLRANGHIKRTTKVVRVYKYYSETHWEFEPTLGRHVQTLRAKHSLEVKNGNGSNLFNIHFFVDELHLLN
jgi:hypothetical protein